MSRTTASALALVLLLIPVLPLGAITNGVPDLADHYSNVGFMAVKYGAYPYLYLWCSGTLIAPDVFLTASHCTIDLESGHADGSNAKAEKVLAIGSMHIAEFRLRPKDILY